MVTYYGPIVHMHWNHLPFSSWCVGTTTTLTGCFFAISRPMKRSIPVPVPNQGRSQNPLRSELFGAGFFLEYSKCLKSNPPWLFVLEKMAELYVTNTETTDNSHHLFFCFCFAPVALTRKAGGLHGPAAWWWSEGQLHISVSFFPLLYKNLSSQGWNFMQLFFGFSVMVSPRPRPQNHLNHGRDEGPQKCLRTLPQCSWAMAWSLAPVWMLQNSKCLVGRPMW